MSAATGIPNLRLQSGIQPRPHRLLGVPGMAVLAYYAVTMGLGTSSDWDMPRDVLVLITAMSFAFLAFGIFGLLLKHSVTRSVLVLGPAASTATKRIAVWLAIVFIATVIGFVLNNSSNFIVGDLYKFSQLALLFLTCYFIFRDRAQPEFFLQILVLIAAFLVFRDILGHWGLINLTLRDLECVQSGNLPEMVFRS